VTRIVSPARASTASSASCAPVSKTSGSAEIGFVAEDVEKLDHRLSTYNKGELIGVQYDHMVALLTKALQEQQEQITHLVRDALEQATRSRWEVLVGKWSGLALKPGETVERKSQTTVPLFGSNVATLEHVSFKERVACTQGAAEKRCVRLVLESTVDPAGLAQATDQLLGKVKAVMKANMGLADQALPEMKVTKLRLDSTLEFIAEPETLVPHRQRTVTTAQVVLQESEAEPKIFDIHSERVESFTPASH